MATQTAIEFALSFLGTPYLYYHIGDVVANVNDGPFWASNGPLPTAEQIKGSSCLCGGVANLMRRKVGLSVPGLAEDWEVPGGTPAWEWYLKEKDRLEPFDVNKEYPDGTLLLRVYRDEYDQGHVAVKVGDRLLQSFPDADYDPTNRSKLGPGVNMDITVEQSHGDGYYEFACLPENWLEKE